MPAILRELALSRIWEALRQAERQRFAAEASGQGLARSNAGATDDSERRKGLRHSHIVPLLVYGSDADKQPFHEHADTINANENGCLFPLETVVVRGQRLFLTNTRNQAELECRVVHVGRRIRGKARVGVEFLRPAPHFWHRS
jgi:hypothetical protein